MFILIIKSDDIMCILIINSDDVFCILQDIAKLREFLHQHFLVTY